MIARARGYTPVAVFFALSLVGAWLFVSACSGVDVGREIEGGVPGGDADRGAELIQEFGCGSCHGIPGIRGADGTVGPPLDQFGERDYIAGAVPNTVENLIMWLLAPSSIEPGTVMPAVGLDEEQARDVAAYLEQLD